jgi:class 3 adenylate cyclase
MTAMDAAIVVEGVLGVVALGAATDAYLTRRRLTRSEEHIQVLEAALRSAEPQGRLLDSKTRAVARTVANSVLQTAERLREGGVTRLLSGSLDDLAGWVSADQHEIEKIAAPDGTVTLFFSDIENSTSINEHIGDGAWLRALKDHEGVVRSTIEANHGHVVKNFGDGFMAVFRDPFAATTASIEIQRRLSIHKRLARIPIRVRIGLHTGQVVTHEGDFFGKNVAMAARVAAQASGGEVLASETVRDVLTAAHSSVRMTAIAEVELKGLSGTHRLWRVSY